MDIIETTGHRYTEVIRIEQNGTEALRSPNRGQLPDHQQKWDAQFMANHITADSHPRQTSISV